MILLFVTIIKSYSILISYCVNKVSDYDVVIVGFGPTGSTLANLLALSSIRTCIIEREDSLYNLPRAVHFDDEVMRVFQTIGIAKTLRKYLIINLVKAFVQVEP